MTPTADNPRQLLAQYKRAMSYIAPYWRRLVPVLIISLLSTLLGLAQPYISKLLIDEALLRRNMRALVGVSAFMLGITVLGFVFSILSSYRYVQVSAQVLFDMRLAVYRRLQALSPRYYANTRMGDIVSRINNDISEVQRISADSVLALLANLVSLVGSVAIMVWLNWKLFLVSVVLLPASVLSLRHYQRRLAGQVRTMRERSAEIGSFLIETLQGMRLVVTSGAEAHEVDRFRQRNRSFVKALLDMQLTSYFAGATPGTILAVSSAILFLYGGKLVIDGAMTVGTLVAILAYHLRLLGPVQSLMSVYTSLVTGAVSLSRVFELLDAPIEVLERPMPSRCLKRRERSPLKA
jgi:ATP-binding cassette subfamily B protein